MSVITVKKSRLKGLKSKYWMTILLSSFALHGYAMSSAEIAGNPEGNITMVEFMDYGCPHCRGMVPVINQLITNNPDLRVVYRPAPLLGGDSVFLETIMIAAQTMPGFNQFRTLVATTSSPLTFNTVMALAQESGIDPEALWKARFDQQVSQVMQENLSLYYGLKQDGIPLILMGDVTQSEPQVVFVGEQSYMTLQNAIINIKEQNHVAVQ